MWERISEHWTKDRKLKGGSDGDRIPPYERGEVPGTITIISGPRREKDGREKRKCQVPLLITRKP